jgi:hypothetical protein
MHLPPRSWEEKVKEMESALAAMNAASDGAAALQADLERTRCV